MPPALSRAGTAIAKPARPTRAPRRGQAMRKARELRAWGAIAAAGAAMRAIDRIVPTAGIATVTAARMRPRMMRSLREAPRAALNCLPFLGHRN